MNYELKRKIQRVFARSRRFLKQRLGISTTILLLSFFTGIFGATAAIVIKNLLHLNISLLNDIMSGGDFRYLYLIFPFLGIIFTIVFVTKIVKDNISHGVSIALKSISKSSGKLRGHNIYSSIVASSMTVGFGGSVGLEAPIVLTGSAIGSNLGKLFNLSPKSTTTLLACGSAAAMAAIFKAPIAAIVFAIEVLMLDLTSSVLLPLLISAATGTVLSILFLGENVMFTECFTSAFNLKNIPLYILLGLLTAAISVYFLRMLRLVERLFRKIKAKYIKAVVGGIALGALILLFPVFYGEGYENINLLLQGNALSFFAASPISRIGGGDLHLFFIIFLVGVIMLKVFATAATTGAGGIGGVFAPSLFVGAFVGFLLAEIGNHYFNLGLPYPNFVLAGMAGVMAGVMHAPLTAIFLIAELSTGYSLLIPLMITASISYLGVRPFEKHSVYTRQLAETGTLRTHNKDKFAMQKLNLMALIDTNVMTIPQRSSLRDYTSYIAQSKRNLFVVVNEKNKFAGLLVMDDHREILFNQELYDLVKVTDLMIQPDVFVYDTDSGEEIIEKFKATHNFNLPVITKEKDYLGFLSKARLLGAYKDLIAEESED